MVKRYAANTGNSDLALVVASDLQPRIGVVTVKKVSGQQEFHH